MQVYDHFRRAEALHPDRTAFLSRDSHYCFSEMGVRSRTIAAGITATAVADARIAVYSPNDVEAFACVLAVFAAERCWLPLNARNAVDENAYILASTECEMLFIHSSLADQLAVFRQQVPTLRHIVCIDRVLEGVESLDQFLARTAGSGFEALPADSGRIASILSTGGTTGRPKGVMWDHRIWEAVISTFWMHQELIDHPVHLVAAPMTHAAGVLAMTLIPAGATTVVLDKVEPLAIMEAIERHKVTHLFLPPTAIYMMLAHPKVREFDYSSLRCFLYAAAPMSVDKLREAMEVFGPVMVQSYGQAEAPMFCSLMGVNDHIDALENPEHVQRLWSCGRSTMLTRLAIMDDDGRLLPAGERGEIVARGSLVMRGYYRDPEKTRETLTGDGWLRTGDVGYQDEDGFFYHVDRKKDMIISGGFNVYSAEVEKVMLAHPAVQDCAVVGVPDEKWGEAVKAVVELKPGRSVTEDELIRDCKEKLGSVKAPKSVEFWESLPRSAVGKVLKRDIRATFWEGQARAV